MSIKDAAAKEAAEKQKAVDRLMGDLEKDMRKLAEKTLQGWGERDTRLDKLEYSFAPYPVPGVHNDRPWARMRIIGIPLKDGCALYVHAEVAFGHGQRSMERRSWSIGLELLQANRYTSVSTASALAPYLK